MTDRWAAMSSSAAPLLCTTRTSSTEPLARIVKLTVTGCGEAGLDLLRPQHPDLALHSGQVVVAAVGTSGDSRARRAELDARRGAARPVPSRTAPADAPVPRSGAPRARRGSRRRRRAGPARVGQAAVPRFGASFGGLITFGGGSGRGGSGFGGSGAAGSGAAGAGAGGSTLGVRLRRAAAAPRTRSRSSAAGPSARARRRRTRRPRSAGAPRATAGTRQRSPGPAPAAPAIWLVDRVVHRCARSRGSSYAKPICSTPAFWILSTTVITSP